LGCLSSDEMEAIKGYGISALNPRRKKSTKTKKSGGEGGEAPCVPGEHPSLLEKSPGEKNPTAIPLYTREGNIEQTARGGGMELLIRISVRHGRGEKIGKSNPRIGFYLHSLRAREGIE